MKKEIKSYEELLKCDGMKFEGNFEGEEMKGVVIVCSDKYVKLQYDIENKQYQSYLIITLEDGKAAFKDYETFLKNSNLSVYVEEEWKPKFGEVVEVSTKDKYEWFKRIFIGENDGMVHCVHRDDEKIFKKNTSSEDYRCCCCWYYVRKYEEPKIEINIEEAKRIIAENKGIKPENVTIKVL